MDELRALRPGWAVVVVFDLIEDLNRAAGTDPQRGSRRPSAAPPGRGQTARVGEGVATLTLFPAPLPPAQRK